MGLPSRKCCVLPAPVAWEGAAVTCTPNAQQAVDSLHQNKRCVFFPPRTKPISLITLEGIYLLSDFEGAGHKR